MLCNIVAIVFCCFCIRWAVGCETLCSMNFRPVCGFDGDCYTDARNLCVMKNRNCRRMESNLPVFQNLRPGKCSTLLKKCPAVGQQTT